MDGEDGLQEVLIPNRFIVIDTGTSFFKIEELPSVDDEKTYPSVEGSFLRRAMIRGVRIRLILPATSTTASATQTDQTPVSVTIRLFTKKPTEADFNALSVEGTEEPKVRKAVLSEDTLPLFSFLAHHK